MEDPLKIQAEIVSRAVPEMGITWGVPGKEQQINRAWRIRIVKRWRTLNSWWGLSTPTQAFHLMVLTGHLNSVGRAP
jgi:hypothetical protein